MERNTRAASGIAFAIVCGVLFWACAGGSGAVGAVRGVTDSTVVIGSWAPLTGPAALWGALGRGTETYFKMINEEGGIHGRRIEFVLRDDAYQPSRTVAAVRQMVERDGVFAFVVGVGTATGMAVKDYLVRNEIPWVGPATGATGWAYPPTEYVFAAYPLYFDEAAALVDHAVNELGWTRVAVLHQNDDFGRSGAVGAEMALERHGLELVEQVSVEVLDTDLSSHALRLRESGAEVVLLWLTPKHGAIILGAASKLGFNPQWMASSVLSDAELMYDITDGLWEGVIFSTLGEFPSSSHPLVQKYQVARERFAPDERGGTFFFAGFMFAEPLVEGLRRAGRDLTAETFIDAMESLDGFQGTGPPLTYGPDQRQGGRSVFLARCVSATEAVRLTDWLETTLDVDEAIRRLGGG
jgi:ABC-type branched-subunit amino acid transport system substrate-binding protein